MLITRNTLKMMALMALITIGANGSAANVRAKNQTTAINEVKAVNRDDPFFRSGIFAITQSQTARLNLFRDDPFFRDNPFFRVALAFVDEDGNILSQKVLDLEAGKSAFLDLKGSDVPPRDSIRTPVRAMVRYVGTPDTRLYMWTPTVEVFDNESGKTSFLVPAVQKVQLTQ